MNALVSYLLAVLMAIAPRVSEPRRAAIARDVAQVVLSEDRAFPDDLEGQKTALVLVAIPHLETGRSWAKWIDDGSCNDPSWREAHAAWLVGGGCDDSKAFGLWQVHPPGDDAVVGRGYVRDRKKGIRAALHIVRESVKAGVGLCFYSGEKYPRCPKADNRLKLARELEVRFPFPVDQTVAER